MIYLDYNSTHPPFLDLIHEAVDAWGENFANPSGISYPSQKNQARIERSRVSVAAALKQLHGCAFPPGSVLFTSTGTEAVYSMVAAFATDNTDAAKETRRASRALLSPYEHECMYAACAFFGIEVERLSADPSGRVDPAEVEHLLEKDPFLFVSVTSVCNETGVIQPLTDIKHATERFAVPFLSDSIQAAGKTSLDLSAPDALIVNGHKIGAGMGAAALLLRNANRFRPIFRGGLQEGGRRAGTENTAAILALDSALNHQSDLILSTGIDARMRSFHEQIESMLRECKATIAGIDSPRSHTTYAVFPPSTLSMDFLLMALDRDELLCSTGSSCKSRARQPSGILKAMGFTEEESLQALRFSTGMFTDQAEVDRFCSVFPELYRRCL